jgi:hypothetical protein
MVPTDIPDPDAPEFDGIKGELSRFFIAHRDALGFTVESDEWIAANVNSITLALIRLTTHARERGDTAWLERHQWWHEAAAGLSDGEPATTLNG